VMLQQVLCKTSSSEKITYRAFVHRKGLTRTRTKVQEHLHHHHRWLQMGRIVQRRRLLPTFNTKYVTDTGTYRYQYWATQLMSEEKN